MKFIDLTIPLGIATPPGPPTNRCRSSISSAWPQWRQRAGVTHSNHLGTHLDGEIHFHTPGKDIASLDMDFLVHEAAGRRFERVLRRL
jgi:arylformamidase